MADAPRAENFKWGFMALPALEEGGDRYSYTFFEQCWVPAVSYTHLNGASMTSLADRIAWLVPQGFVRPSGTE